ncbi:MAG: sulfatase, partial [Haloferula sp.]
KLLFAPQRAKEELYLYREDVWQIRNLAADPEHAEALARHRALLDQWMKDTKDPGSESPEVYVLETEDQMKSIRNAAAREVFRKNTELYKQWAREGK